MISLKVTGTEEFTRALRALPERVRRPVLRDALSDAAEPIRRRMGELAPRAPGLPDLAENMVVSAVTEVEGTRLPETSAAVAIGPARLLKGSYSVVSRITGRVRTIGYSFYAYFQEFGTVHHRPQPFARPAFEREHSKALGIYGKAIWTALTARGGGIRTGSGSGPVTGGPGGSGLL